MTAKRLAHDALVVDEWNYIGFLPLRFNPGCRSWTLDNADIFLSHLLFERCIIWGGEQEVSQIVVLFEAISHFLATWAHVLWISKLLLVAHCLQNLKVWVRRFTATWLALRVWTRDGLGFFLAAVKMTLIDLKVRVIIHFNGWDLQLVMSTVDCLDNVLFFNVGRSRWARFQQIYFVNISNQFLHRGLFINLFGDWRERLNGLELVSGRFLRMQRRHFFVRVVPVEIHVPVVFETDTWLASFIWHSSR